MVFNHHCQALPASLYHLLKSSIFFFAFRFDHHQKTFHDTLSEEAFQTRLSSAGLVYRHYGRQILKQLVEGTSVPEDVVDKKLYAKVYKVSGRTRTP